MARLDALPEPGATDRPFALVLPAPPAVELFAPSSERFAAEPIFTPTPILNEAQAKTFADALGAYRRGDREAGDALAAAFEDPAVRLALEWAAIRTSRQGTGFARLRRFLDRQADFPMAGWVRRRAELALLAERQDAGVVKAFFADRAPEMAAGQLAKALALRSSGDEAGARQLARSAWRDHRSTAALEAKILEAFSDAITPADHRYLALKFAHDDEPGEAARVAARVKGDLPALVNLLVASNQKGRSNKAQSNKAQVEKAPAAIKKDAHYALALSRALRRAGDHAGAAKALLDAPRALEDIVDGDEWWIERRLQLRKMLELGDPKTALALALSHPAQSASARADAAFHAGWVALRFLREAQAARAHFTQSLEAAQTAHDLSRALYWRARARETLGEDGREDLGRAAVHAHTYHGQLAVDHAGLGILPRAEEDLNASPVAAFGETPFGRALRLLLDHGGREFALPLVYDFALTRDDPAELAALGDLVAGYRDPRLLLMLGKTAQRRRFAVERHAFPTFGIPAFERLPGSAEAPMVYAIARQESAFDAKAVSHAGARGLMQLMPATAARTANNFSVPFDQDKLLSDPAYNAQIGAAHLGELLQLYRGSYILSFAAYNAGPRRVKEWIEAFGDPREPGVDPIDWVERIPFNETRHYVQTVMENLQIYRARLSGDRRIAIRDDLARARTAAAEGPIERRAGSP